MRGKKRAYTFIKGDEVLKFKSTADARQHFGMFDMKWPTKYIRTGWRGWTIQPELWEGEAVKKKKRTPVPGVEYKKLSECIKDEDQLYYIGTATGFVCIVTGREYPKHIRAWSEIFKKRIKRLCEEQKKRLDLAYDSKDSKHIQTCAEELAKRIKYLEEWTDFSERPVLENYQRISGGTALILPGDEVGVFWEHDEYVQRYKKFVK